METQADFLAVREMGFDVVQGFLFGKPMTAKQFMLTTRCAGMDHAPRFYFHLSAPDQDFKDKIGSDAGRPFCRPFPRSARLADRIMMYPAFPRTARA